MLNAYLLVKLVHVVGATLLFGTGLGTAFFMLAAYRAGDVEALRVTSRHVVWADWLFTLPAVVVQLATGLWLTSYLQIAWSSVWFVLVSSSFVVVGLCWLRVVVIQIEISRLAGARAGGAEPGRVQALMRAWVALGVPAFLLTLVLLGLMVLKPGLA